MSSRFQPAYCHEPSVVPMVQRRNTLAWPSATALMSITCSAQALSAISELLVHTGTKSTPLLLTETVAWS